MEDTVYPVPLSTSLVLNKPNKCKLLLFLCVELIELETVCCENENNLGAPLPKRITQAIKDHRATKQDIQNNIAFNE